MNTSEVDHILNKFLPRNHVKYLGVLPRDHSRTLLSSKLDHHHHHHSYPLCFVSNTQPSSKPGEHWVAFFLSSSDSVEFFDSYGLAPSVYGFFIKPSARNSFTIQQLDSNVCAHYCIFYLYHRARGKSMYQIVSSFSRDDLVWNDLSVSRFVTKLDQ